MIKCENCESQYKDIRTHKRYCDQHYMKKDLVIKLYVEDKLSIRDICRNLKLSKDRVTKFIGDNMRTVGESVKVLWIKNPKLNVHTDESKRNLREKRLKWMKENPEKTAWRQSNMSYPEKIFLEYIQGNEWDKKYLIIREKSFFPYFADFTFENEKIVIEIDGSQHLKEEIIKRDILKDKLITELGYLVVRIPAINVLKDIENTFIEINNILNNSNNKNNIGGVIKFGIFKSEKKKYIPKYDSNFDRAKSRFKSRIVERPSYDILIKEVDELGYVGTGKKYGVSDNTVRKWIQLYKKYGSDF